jgi:putative protease
VLSVKKNTVRVRLRAELSSGEIAELSAGDGVAFGAAASQAGGTLWGVRAEDRVAGVQGRVVTLELEDKRALVGVSAGQLVRRCNPT